MKPSTALVSLALATAGCHVASSQPLSEITRTRSLIYDRLPADHPIRGPLLVYASSLDQALRHPGDATATRATVVAMNCLGFMPEGHLAYEVKAAVDAALTDSPTRQAAYRRYVMQSSSVAITRDEVECQQQ